MHCHVAVPGAGGETPRKRAVAQRGCFPGSQNFGNHVSGTGANRIGNGTGLQQGTPFSPRHEDSTLVRDITGGTKNPLSTLARLNEFGGKDKNKNQTINIITSFLNLNSADFDGVFVENALVGLSFQCVGFLKETNCPKGESPNLP